jgi:hypothetical protein
MRGIEIIRADEQSELLAAMDILALPTCFTVKSRDCCPVHRKDC